MIFRMMLLASTIAAATGAVARAATTDILVGLDEKVTFGPDGQVNGPPGSDAVVVLDVSDPAHPRIRASLPLTNSVLGPPTNLQITPDGRIGLVANSVNTVKNGDTWSNAPDDKLYVIDLDANPPKLVDTLTVGKQPSGLAISRNGDLALIANRAGKSVSVVSIQGSTVRLVGEVPMEDEVAAVAITPDGKRAFVCKNIVSKVAVLTINGDRVTWDKSLDIATGNNPYNVAVTPDGRYALVSNSGIGNGNIDTVSVLDAAAAHPHAIDIVAVGIGPEGFAVSPDGKFAAAPLLLGSSLKHSAWNYTRNGAVALIGIGAGGALQMRNTLPAGGIPEAVAFSPGGDYLYIGNYADRNLQVFHIEGDHLVNTGTKLDLPGHPASMRGPAR